MSNLLNLTDSINEGFKSGKTPTFIYNGTTYDFSPAGLITFFTANGTLPAAVTATAAELNILDGATLSTAELNILDGVTASAAELNLTDGLTATTAEINLVADNQQRAVTATDDGLTTGLLLATDNTVVITSANADHIVTLPAIAGVAMWQQIKLQIGANGCELRTVAESGTTINNVDSDGTNEMAIPADSIVVVTKQSATNFIAEVYVAAGTRTIPTPDAA